MQKSWKEEEKKQYKENCKKNLKPAKKEKCRKPEKMWETVEKSPGKRALEI